MLKLFKNFTKKDKLIIVIIAILVIGSVWLDLKMPEYMSEITKLVQTKDSTLKEIYKSGGFMLLCCAGSLICEITCGYFTSLSCSSNLPSKLASKSYVTEQI